MISSDGCGETKGCYRDPADCTYGGGENNCNFLLTWTNLDDTVLFQFDIDIADDYGALDSSFWGAVGISNTKEMV